LSLGDGFAEVHVAFECASRDDQVRVTLGIDCGDVVVVIAILVSLTLLFLLL
jgi:hypothetical protein